MMPKGWVGILLGAAFASIQGNKIAKITPK
jgi:hypothetical protein